MYNNNSYEDKSLQSFEAEDIKKFFDQADELGNYNACPYDVENIFELHRNNGGPFYEELSTRFNRKDLRDLPMSMTKIIIDNAVGKISNWVYDKRTFDYKVNQQLQQQNRISQEKIDEFKQHIVNYIEKKTIRKWIQCTLLYGRSVYDTDKDVILTPNEVEINGMSVCVKNDEGEAYGNLHHEGKWYYFDLSITEYPEEMQDQMLMEGHGRDQQYKPGDDGFGDPNEEPKVLSGLPPHITEISHPSLIVADYDETGVAEKLLFDEISKLEFEITMRNIGRALDSRSLIYNKNVFDQSTINQLFNRKAIGADFNKQNANQPVLQYTQSQEELLPILEKQIEYLMMRSQRKVGLTYIAPVTPISEKTATEARQEYLEANVELRRFLDDFIRSVGLALESILEKLGIGGLFEIDILENPIDAGLQMEGARELIRIMSEDAQIDMFAAGGHYGPRSRRMAINTYMKHFKINTDDYMVPMEETWASAHDSQQGEMDANTKMAEGQLMLGQAAIMQQENKADEIVVTAETEAKKITGDHELEYIKSNTSAEKVYSELMTSIINNSTGDNDVNMSEVLTNFNKAADAIKKKEKDKSIPD